MKITSPLVRHAIRILEPFRAHMTECDISDDQLQPQQMLVESECSVVSAGTELAIYRGSESWCKPPTEIGYGLVGRVLRTGSKARFQHGDRIFCRAPHADLNIVTDGYPVPNRIDSQVAPLVARMGQVAFTAVRVARPELGDVVAVLGLGLVGNLCAQLMRLSGCTVIGLDVSDKRLAIATTCGIQHVINTRLENAAEVMKKITGGAMCRHVVEATGIPGLVATATELAARHGQVILLGTPRGEFTGDATELLRNVHHSHKHVTLVGAHEWIYPDHPSDSGHSITTNISQLFAMAEAGTLHAKELISHCLRPVQCQEVYERLLARDDDYFGVIFDWRSP
jgi:threonine dehydrogenase-like Zn-dependent dehydrogenase